MLVKWAKLPCPEYKPNRIKAGLLTLPGATVPSSQATPHFLYTGCTQPKQGPRLLQFGGHPVPPFLGLRMASCLMARFQAVQEQHLAQLRQPRSLRCGAVPGQAWAARKQPWGDGWNGSASQHSCADRFPPRHPGLGGAGWVRSAGSRVPSSDCRPTGSPATRREGDQELSNKGAHTWIQGRALKFNRTAHHSPMSLALGSLALWGSRHADGEDSWM